MADVRDDRPDEHGCRGVRIGPGLPLDGRPLDGLPLLDGVGDAVADCLAEHERHRLCQDRHP